MSITERLNNFLTKYTVELYAQKASNGKYLEWLGNDYESTFKENYKKYPEYLEYYIKYPIKYYINKQYFRSKFDFEPDKSKKVNIFLGCSHTFGIGLHWEHTWPVLLSEKIGGEFINLGIPGGSIEASYITLKRFIDMYDVQNVFHLQPVYARFLAFDKGKLSSFIAIQENIFRMLRVFFTEYYVKNLFHDPDYMVYSHIKYMENIKYICQKRNIPYFYNHIVPYFTPPGHPSLKKLLIGQRKMDWKNNILARDLSHPPLSSTKKIADKFFKFVTENPSGYSSIDI